MVELARANTILTADIAKLQKMVYRYAKQVADHFRAEKLAKEPELVETARLFSISVSDGSNSPNAVATVPIAPVVSEADSISDGTDELDDDGDEEPETAGDDGEEPASDSVPPPDLVARVAECLRKNPGSRTEEIATALDATTADVGSALRSLISGKRATKRGKARGTRYFAR